MSLKCGGWDKCWGGRGEGGGRHREKKRERSKGYKREREGSRCLEKKRLTCLVRLLGLKKHPPKRFHRYNWFYYNLYSCLFACRFPWTVRLAPVSKRSVSWISATKTSTKLLLRLMRNTPKASPSRFQDNKGKRCLKPGKEWDLAGGLLTVMFSV